jgi:CheY-like chemotaxis protein
MGHLDRILIIEDDNIDANTIIRSFKSISPESQLTHKKNGLEAMEYLTEVDVCPQLILLDINMPLMNGHEFLEAMRKDDKLKSIPVIVLTTSKDEKDKFRAYNNGVEGYMLKPIQAERFLGLIEAIDLYWSLNELPD